MQLMRMTMSLSAHGIGLARLHDMLTFPAGLVDLAAQAEVQQPCSMRRAAVGPPRHPTSELQAQYRLAINGAAQCTSLAL